MSFGIDEGAIARRLASARGRPFECLHSYDGESLELAVVGLPLATRLDNTYASLQVGLQRTQQVLTYDPRVFNEAKALFD